MLMYLIGAAIGFIAAWKYKRTWKILKFYISFIQKKKYTLKRYYISFLSALILSVVIRPYIILCWFLCVYVVHMAYLNYHNQKYKNKFETCGFSPAPHFLAQQKNKNDMRLLFSNSQTVDFWYTKKQRLEVLLNSNISYIGYGPKRTNMVIVLKKPVNLKLTYQDKKQPMKVRFSAVFEALNIHISVKKIIDTYATQEILFDSTCSIKELEAKKTEVMRRLGIESMDTGHRDGWISWKIIYQMAAYRFLPAFKEAKKTGIVPVLIGQAEKTIVIDVIKSFHWLIVGSTGAGKSNMVNVIISCMLLSQNRNIARFYFLDPKEVELAKYKDFGEYRGKIPDIMAELRGLEIEMNNRYALMAQEGADCIEKCKTKLGYKIIVVEEIADIMLNKKYKDEFADIIQSLTQKGRAAGFRLFLTTQAPYREVIKGPIKVNTANRIVGAMPDRPTSITALGDGRAADLSGEAGEVILKMPGYNLVVKTPWMSENDISQVMAMINKKVVLLK